MTSFARNWLSIQCQVISNLDCAILLLVDNKNKPQLTAQWPEQDRQCLELLAIAQQALSKQQTIVNTVEKEADDAVEKTDYLAHPLWINQQLIAVIAIKTKAKSVDERQKLVEWLTSNTRWLALSNSDNYEDDDFYSKVVQLTSRCFEQDKYQHCVTTLIAELNSYFACERISFGEYKNRKTKLTALSNSAQFDDKTQLIRLIVDAMDEAIDQDKIIVSPIADANEMVIDFAHRELLRTFAAGSVCTVPMSCNGEMFGAITLEFHDQNAVDPEALRLLKMTLSMATPFLKIKKTEERWLGKKIWDAMIQWPERTFNLEHLGLKLAGSSLALVLLSAAIIDGDFRIAADANLEGKVQRTIAAPMDGFIESADVRAGDTVAKDQIMAMMEDDDLELQKIKLSSQQQKLKREYREALADHDLVKIRILDAQIDQNQAQSQLVNERLRRTRIKAPFQGVVIEGDLSQSLGSPVERGDGLFKIAPLEGYRIILKVNEKDISHVHPGQSGVLMLSSFPGTKLDLSVKKITSIASAEDGENVFRVEAALAEPPENLRPGMEGIGKIDTGPKKLLWIWTHDFVAWLKLCLWSWLP